MVTDGLPLRISLVSRYEACSSTLVICRRYCLITKLFYMLVSGYEVGLLDCVSEVSFGTSVV